MSEPILMDDFNQPAPHPSLKWYCPPKRWTIEQSRLILFPDAKTDYWQKTHYGFSNDNGHFLYLPLEGDFVLSTRVRFFPAHQYDQAGLMVRFSPECWLKSSVEFEPDGPGRLGSVVTNFGYSDWATQDFAAGKNELSLRIQRVGPDFTVHASEAGGSEPGLEVWTQIRMAHLHQVEALPVLAGLYACSPIEAGYRAEFMYLLFQNKL